MRPDAVRTCLPALLWKLVYEDWNPLDLSDSSSGAYDRFLPELVEVCLAAKNGYAIEEALERLESEITGRHGLDLTNAARYSRRHDFVEEVMGVQNLWTEWDAIASDAGFGLWRVFEGIEDLEYRVSVPLEEMLDRALPLLRPFLVQGRILVADLAADGSLIPRAGSIDEQLDLIRSQTLDIGRPVRQGEPALFVDTRALEHTWDRATYRGILNPVDAAGLQTLWLYRATDEFDLADLVEDVSTALGTEDGLRECCLSLLRESLHVRTLRAGDFRKPWDASPDEQLLRIENAWREGRPPEHWAVCLYGGPPELNP